MEVETFKLGPPFAYSCELKNILICRKYPASCVTLCGSSGIPRFCNGRKCVQFRMICLEDDISAYLFCLIMIMLGCPTIASISSQF
jgi:hypothetical protein